MPNRSNVSIISCPKCRRPLPWAVLDHSAEHCPECKTTLEVTVYPALFKGIAEGQTGETLLEDGLASCFYHPEKKATIACESCGRFLCTLCDIELSEQHVCASCLESGKRKGKIEQISTHRVLYDDVALAVALLPLLMWPVTLISAPIALFLSIKYWKAPSSIIPRTKLRLLMAIIFALLQIAGWILFAGYMWLDW